MTRQNAYIRHYQMWDELVKHPVWEKHDTSHWDHMVDNDIIQYCYLCEVHPHAGCGEDEDECIECPLREASGKDCYWDVSWYSKWSDAKTAKTRIKYATLIRDCVIPYLTAKSKQQLGVEP